MNFVPRVITAEMAAKGYNNQGRGRLLGYISDPKEHETACPYRKNPAKATCACRIGLWQEDVPQPRDEPDKTRWAKKQRHKFIMETLKASGMLRRADLAKKFSISTAQASADIKSFLAENPDAMKYDASKKAYLRAFDYDPPTRDTTEAAKVLAAADDARLRGIALRDPDMIRDVAAALIYERSP